MTLNAGCPGWRSPSGSVRHLNQTKVLSGLVWTIKACPSGSSAISIISSWSRIKTAGIFRSFDWLRTGTILRLMYYLLWLCHPSLSRQRAAVSQTLDNGTRYSLKHMPGCFRGFQTNGRSQPFKGGIPAHRSSESGGQDRGLKSHYDGETVMAAIRGGNISLTEGPGMSRYKESRLQHAAAGWYAGPAGIIRSISRLPSEPATYGKDACRPVSACQYLSARWTFQPVSVTCSLIRYSTSRGYNSDKEKGTTLPNSFASFRAGMNIIIWVWTNLNDDGLFESVSNND